MTESRKIDNHWYDLERGGLSRHEAVDFAAAWKRNQRRWSMGRGSSGKHFYARAVPYEGKYAVFARHSGF